ncbi:MULTISPECIES: hypothetical protein [Exiguobacterium]|uniref:Uncharacterized protein n=1 Tax=Exiguobacterium acetylicum TaxID=41170 RepID=A0ABX8GCX2_EXIAC|nr:MULTISPECIES: hypothetical protein [Exiguobacterium]AOT00268.1 hypothetical protein ESP131_08340 [Exiguobacterium sp. U13-1]QWB31228.1 hypothetical protein KKI46_06140 [Exiguobacterium acetylicum]HCD58819.1 hypothetical protein [Exiguobacterium sp.]
MGLKKRYLFGAGVIAGASLLLFRKREQSTQTDALRDYLAHLDQDPSPDAAKDPDEVGLTKLDSIYRSEWQANGFPRSRTELEELEK